MEKESLLAETSVVLPNNEVQNGRFVFSSTESLKETIEELEKVELEIVQKSFENKYEKGFRSYKPIVSSDNLVLQTQLSKEITLKKEQKGTSKSTDDDDDLISDPLLAAFVNDNNEIIVNDSLYKIVEDQGVLIVHVKDTTYLYDYLKNQNKTSKISSRIASDCGGYQQMDDRITLFIAPIDDCGGGSSSGGGGGTGGTSSPVVDPEVALQNIISSLQNCDINKSFFQNLFGKSYSCTDDFDSRHRIKTEFWDQSWGFYKSAGILTKTQTKTLGIWWESNSDEIHMGINKILLKYNVPAPEIYKYKNPNIHSDFIKSLSPVYMYNSYYYTKNESFTSNIGNTTFNNIWYTTTLKVEKNSIPFFDFEDADILNIYIPLQNISGKLNALDVNITVGNTILTDSNIKNLYKAGFDFLKSIGSTKKNFVVTNQLNANEIELLYFGQRYKNTNTNILKDRIFQDADFLVGYTKSLNGRGSSQFSFDFSPVANVGSRNYTYYELDFYGLARRGSTWKGSRLVRKN